VSLKVQLLTWLGALILELKSEETVALELQLPSADTPQFVLNLMGVAAGDSHHGVLLIFQSLLKDNDIKVSYSY